MNNIRKAVLSNGVRVLVEPVDYVRSASIGLWCHTGSSHELDGEAGVTHFIEHMLFKGTKNRTAKQIAEAIEGRGGVLNAFTDKEQTCYYARVLADDVANAVDVLCDMLTNSLLDSEELEREKGVVLEEIKRGEDEPSEHVHDLHFQRRWPDHPLGKSVAGTRESVGGLTREDVQRYLSRRYRGGHLVLSAAGLVDPDAFVAMAEERLSCLEPASDVEPLPRPIGAPTRTLVGKPVEQVHFCIGGDAPSLYEDDLYTSVVMDAVLGSGMSSRLFQEIREKRGLVYAIGSYNTLYQSGGAFTIYGGTGMETWPEVEELINSELARLMKDGISDAEMSRSKRSISGTMVLALEGMSARMIRMTKNELIYGRDVPVEESLRMVDAVTNEQVIELARRYLSPELVGVTAIGPFGED